MNLQDKIELSLSQGRVEGAKKLLSTLYAQEDKQAWDKAKREEYDSLYLEEINYFETEINEDGDEVEVVKQKMEYKEDSPSYTEWINEVKTITPEVKEESHLDKDGMTVIDTPYKPAVTEQVRPYTPLSEEEILAKVEAYLSESTEYKALLKEKKVKALNAITVEVNGKVFDGDETARLNMLSALQAATVTKQSKTYWKLANNEIAEVTVDEINEALTKAISSVGNVVVGE